MAYDTSHIENLPDGLDPEIVKQTHKGKGWGAQDQARYDAAIGKKMKGSDVQDSGANRQEKIANMDQHVKDGGYLGGVAQRKYDRMTAKERANNFQANSTDIKNTQTQTVTQDNDQNSTVTGDNNYVYQNQDNSVRNYGGDNRSFVYNSNGEGPDTPATMATLSGFYDADDSPAAKAKRLDQAVTMNRDNQKKYANTSHIAQGAIARADRNRYIDPNALDKRIAQREQYSRDKATVMSANMFGDMGNFNAPDWKSADPAKPVEAPDFEKMYDKYAP